jgi:hypothetical protein
MKEATLVYQPKTVRNIFAQLLVAYCDIQDPLKLYLDFMSSMAEDFRRIDDSETISSEAQQKVIDETHELQHPPSGRPTLPQFTEDDVEDKQSRTNEHEGPYSTKKILSRTSTIDL